MGKASRRKRERREHRIRSNRRASLLWFGAPDPGCDDLLAWGRYGRRIVAALPPVDEQQEAKIRSLIEEKLAPLYENAEKL